ncbi:MAG: hypothetical protein LUH15_16050, partial [Tannerellaceae bacterium]|nr:hypothetical protein [Tannerellaceae bacterium]
PARTTPDRTPSGKLERRRLAKRPATKKRKQASPYPGKKHSFAMIGILMIQRDEKVYLNRYFFL